MGEDRGKGERERRGRGERGSNLGGGGGFKRGDAGHDAVREAYDGAGAGEEAAHVRQVDQQPDLHVVW